MVLDHLFAGADDFTDFAIGETLPHQNRDLDFFRSKALARGLLLAENRNGQLHPLAAFVDSGAQKQSAQVLLYRARTDVELACNFLVAAALHEQV
jgi:hypothetical protein